MQGYPEPACKRPRLIQAALSRYGAYAIPIQELRMRLSRSLTYASPQQPAHYFVKGLAHRFTVEGGVNVAEKCINGGSNLVYLRD